MLLGTSHDRQKRYGNVRGRDPDERGCRQYPGENPGAPEDSDGIISALRPIPARRRLLQSPAGRIL